jgi:spermidine/putrescine transport system substrate-binding protein
MSDRQPPNLDPALIRGLLQRRVSRRDVMRYAGIGAGALGMSAFLAACGVSGSSGGASSSPTVDVGAFWDKQSLHHVLNFANWPYYIDTAKGSHPSLDLFTKKTGIKVNYKPAIQDNASFFATLRPSLQAGKDTGWDLMVLTNGAQLTRLIEFGWLIPLDHDKLPNFAKYASPSVKDPNYDPGNRYTLTWQSGFTGIAVNTKYIKDHITSVQSLWNSAYKGKVGMMSDNTELGSVGLLALGMDPATPDVADWKKAAAKLQQQRDAGLVRNYYDQSYINALQNGDVWITQAWSGDIFQSQQSGYPELKFIVPDEGVMLWHDNMMIPAHAQNPLDALTYMDFVYQPKIAAMITPVPDAKAIIANQLDDPAVAHSQLVFPSNATYQKAHDYYTFKNFQDEQQWNDIFQPIIEG